MRRWHFRCKTCGAYADGFQEAIEYFAWMHVDQLPSHKAEYWAHGQREEAIDASQGSNK